MIVRVWGESDELSEDEIVSAVQFMGETLMGESRRGVTVNVEMTGRMPGRTGQVICVDPAKPTSFLIQVDAASGRATRQLKTLAHEMVHVRQMVLGYMAVEGPSIVWRSSHRSSPEPWEDEAHRLEAGLVAAWRSVRRRSLVV